MTAPWEMPPAASAAERLAMIAAAVPVLETERLVLRAPHIGDFAAYAAIVTTERGAHVGGPFSRHDAWLDFCQMVAGWLLRGYGLWSIERRADGAHLGFGILNHEFGDPEPELGWMLAENAEGEGYATEAAIAIRDHAFSVIGPGSVVSYIARDNARSIALAERLGAERDDIAQGSETIDCLVYRHQQESPSPRRPE